MTSLPLAVVAPLRRSRAFSQRALRRYEDVSRASSSSSSSSTSTSTGVNSNSTAHASSSRPPQVQHTLDGRSYLLPTMTLQRVPGSHAIAPLVPTDGSLMQPRARKTPIVLDLQLVSSDGSPHAQPIKKQELRAEIERLNSLGFIPVGVTNASEDIKQLAQKLYLPSFISTRMQQPQQHQQQSLHPQDSSPSTTQATETTEPPHPSLELEETTSPSAASEQQATAAPPPMVVRSSVRSGQQIFAQNRSLVVLGNVNSGAEVLADGDIYVLGALKGRALAGIGGDVHARISCQSFDAELVSIAHHFTTCENLAALSPAATAGGGHGGDLTPLKPTTICLQDDHLHFQSMA